MPHTPSVSMSNGPNPWNHSSIPLSILTNGVPSAGTQLRACNTVDGAETETKNSNDSSGCSTVKERNYIGLSEHSSVSVPQDKNTLAAAQVCAKSFDLDLQDTELRLGIGPSVVAQDAVASPYGNAARETAMQDGLSAPRSVAAEARSDCKVVEISSSKTYGFEHNPLPEQQPPEQRISSAEHPLARKANGSWERASRAAPNVSCTPLESYQSWGEKRFVSLPVASAADRSLFASQQSSASESHATEFNNSAKENVCMQGYSHRAVSDRSLPLKPPNAGGGLELRFAHQEAFQNFWHAQTSRHLQSFRVQSAQDDQTRQVFGGLARGTFAIPVPKVCTVPAKRPYPYFETLGDNSRILIPMGAPAQGGMNSSSTTEAEGKLGAPQGQPASGLFSWNNVVQLPTGWQMGLEQSKGVLDSMATSSTLPSRVQATPEARAPAGSWPASEPLKDAKDKPPLHPVKQASTGSQNEEGGSRAPVVGWPPIRSFRKNTLAAHPKASEEDQEVHGDAVDQGKSTSLFVKANMDGVPFGRKLDLKSYDSYASLKLALQDMFQRFFNGHKIAEIASSSEQKKLNLTNGTDYVLTHEDKDGDWMLVGDVPWEMFVTTVRRLRIVKGSDAASLGQRKLNVQATKN